MFEDFELFPEAASSIAGSIDALYLYLVGLSVFFGVGIAVTLIFFAVRYRRRHPDEVGADIHGSIKLELLWSAVPLAITMTIFGWGAKLYFETQTLPGDGMQYLVTGKQWMWRVQHPTGHREINSIHVPVGQNVILTMTSEDVIHDFYIPAFRVKCDVVPGMYTRAWFQATRVGTYHLFCAEYCGTKHSEMIGQVVVMDPVDYEAWLGGQPAAQSPAEAGAVLFERQRCVTCHAAGASQRGPSLEGRWGLPVPLEGGGSVVFDQEYVRESILEPNARVSAGYQPVMPTYKGQISEEQIFQIGAYVRSLSEQGETR